MYGYLPNVGAVPVPTQETTGDQVSTRRYCEKCGRRLIEVVEESPLFDNTTGERRTDVYLECPRFPRSWRNFWWGGVGHTSVTTGTSHMLREWR